MVTSNDPVYKPGDHVMCRGRIIKPLGHGNYLVEFDPATPAAVVGIPAIEVPRTDAVSKAEFRLGTLK